MSRVFPLNPSLNQEITVGSKTFVWSGDRWQRSRVTSSDVTSSDAQTLVSAQSYADTQDAALSATITAAYEAYVDGQTADSATVTYVDDGDAVTLTAANTYTDARESAITTAYQSYADTAETDAKAYTDTEIANLVDSSPATLDTLNELAAALGDDANFATTVTNSIATKAPLDSPSFTGTVDFSNSTVQGLEIPQPIHPFVMLGA
jgi:hypothetical protein